MAAVDDLLSVMDDPRRAGLQADNPAGAALLSLLVHVAFSDRQLDPSELAFLARVLPGRDPAQLQRWAMDEGARPLDFAAIALAVPSQEERARCLRFAVRMAWKDGRFADEEREMLSRLVMALGLPDVALFRELADVAGRGATAVDPARIREAFKQVGWDAVDAEEGALQSDLSFAVPAGAIGVLRLGVDETEQIGLYREGLAGRFREGNAWLPWADIVTFTRAATLAAVAQLHAEDGQVWTLTDFRLAGIGAFLDQLYRAETRGKAAIAPTVHVLRSHKD